MTYELLKRTITEHPDGSLTVTRWLRHKATRIIIRKVTLTPAT